MYNPQNILKEEHVLKVSKFYQGELWLPDPTLYAIGYMGKHMRSINV